MESPSTIQVFATSFLPKLLLFHSLTLFQPVTSKLKASEIPEFIEALKSRRTVPGDGSLISSRQTLPPDVFGSEKGVSLTCGSHVPISSKGYFYFRLNSPEECSLAFLGSATQNCTVSILCAGQIAMNPRSCRQGYMILHDGSTGLQKGCGTFTFNKTPRYPRNGRDLYVVYKGTASNTCVAFCMQDITEDHLSSGSLSTPKMIKRNLLPPPIRIDETCTCGLKNEQGGRIVGGEEASPFEFPWMAAIVLKTSGFERKPFCSGSLVSDRYVVSAGHCFDGLKLEASDIEVLLHAHTLEFMVKAGDTGTEPGYQEIPGYDQTIKTDRDEGTFRLSVNKITIHPLYSSSFDFDVALLKLGKAVNIRDRKFTPICLPKIGEYLTYPDIMHTVAGWGLTHKNAQGTSRLLQKVDVPLENCEKVGTAQRRHICGGKDYCYGDSGGPLMYKFKEGQYWLSGVVSAGSGCANPKTLGLYTNVQELVQWIYYQSGRADSYFCKM